MRYLLLLCICFGLIFSFLGISGCEQKPLEEPTQPAVTEPETKGEMIKEGEEMMEEGEEMMEEGGGMMEKGKEMMEKREGMMEKGHEMMEKGKEMME